MAEWPAKSEPFHDARDDAFTEIPPEEIEAFLAAFREHLVEPAPKPDPALADREEEQ